MHYPWFAERQSITHAFLNVLHDFFEMFFYDRSNFTIITCVFFLAVVFSWSLHIITFCSHCCRCCYLSILFSPFTHFVYLLMINLPCFLFFFLFGKDSWQLVYFVNVLVFSSSPYIRRTNGTFVTVCWMLRGRHHLLWFEHNLIFSSAHDNSTFPVINLLYVENIWSLFRSFFPSQVWWYRYSKTRSFRSLFFSSDLSFTFLQVF